MADPRVRSLFAGAKEEADEEPASRDDGGAKEMSAKRFYEAGAAGDWAKAASALERFIQLCDGYDEGE